MQRVVNHIAVIADDIARRDTGIEHAQVGMHHGGDGLAGRMHRRRQHRQREGSRNRQTRQRKFRDGRGTQPT